MIVGKFDPQQFFRRSEAVAALVAGSELFGLLRRSLDLPGQWAALLTREAGDHVFVRAGGKVAGDGVEDVLFVRTTPFDLSWDEDSLFSRDGFECRASVRLRLSLISERGELLSFAKAVLGSHRVATAAGLVRYVQAAVRAALLQFAAQRDAAAVIDGEAASGPAAALAEAVEPLCFAAGLVVEGAPAARFDSAAYRQVRHAQEEALIRQKEHESARHLQQTLERAQGEHLDHVGTLLSRLQEMAKTSPEVQLPDLIRSFSQQHRGEVYTALFSSPGTTSRTQWVVVAVGEELLYFDARSLGVPNRRFTVVGAAGPVRSIQAFADAAGRPVLWLGAAAGVYRWPIDRAQPDEVFLVPGTPAVRGGFNAVAVGGDRIWASHSELGLYEWTTAAPADGRSKFESMTRGASSVRHVQVCGADAFCSIDDRIVRWPAEGVADRPTGVYTGSGSALTGLCSSGESLYAGNSDGEVLHWSVERQHPPEQIHRGRGRPAESVCVLPSHGVRRLLYTDTSPYVHAQVIGDTFACRYEAGGQTLRRVECAADLLVATNELRDRLIVWSPGRPDRPIDTIGVAALCGRTVQDVCLVPAT